MLLGKYLLAPGDVFWNKKSGKKVLLSKKGELLNINLIKKIEQNKEKIILENHINFEIQKLFQGYFAEMRNELQIKEKIALREKILGRFSSFFLEEETEQLELDLLSWILFSSFSYEESRDFINHDSEIFKRHLSVASTYTFCALMLGYYDSKFLTMLFTKTLRNLLSIGNANEVLLTKDKLESFIQKDSFKGADLNLIKEFETKENLLFSGFFERYDGTGLSNTNIREMIDLEVVLIAINRHLNFNRKAESNFFKTLVNDGFICDQKITTLIKRTLTERDKGIVQIIGLG